MVNDPANLAPLYTQLADTLRERIVSGSYGAHAAIPSQSEMVEEFAVSPITVRRAIRELTFEGLLYARQGVGVFVTDRRKIVRTLVTGRFASIREDIVRAGMEPAVKEISFGRCEPDSDAIARLGLRSKAPLYQHQKVILADGIPIALDTIQLPPRLAEQLREGLAGDFLFVLLARVGIKIGTVKREFEGALAGASEAKLLGGVPPLPLLDERYDVFNSDGAPLLSGRTAMRSDRIRYEIANQN
jgi:GntR family transcriptional regulator